MRGQSSWRAVVPQTYIVLQPVCFLSSPDEATSALDSVSERLVQEAIDNLVKVRSFQFL
jgi:ABC-type transport system involved in Fe-S cluster assembly fused permease/ATPase subunit